MCDDRDILERLQRVDETLFKQHAHFVELIQRHTHTKRAITDWHSAKMILKMIYSSVFHSPEHKWASYFCASVGVCEIFVIRMCRRSFIPFSWFWSASREDSWAMTQVFVSLRGSISMTDLIYPRRIQRGPWCRKRELQLAAQQKGSLDHWVNDSMCE